MNTLIKTKYFWFDHWAAMTRATDCEIVKDDPSFKRVTIRLLAYGPNNTPPKTEMKVGRNKLECYRNKTFFDK